MADASGYGPSPLASLNAATTTGAAPVTNYWDCRSGCFPQTMQTIITGAPATCTVLLEGSLDGLHFFTLATSTSTTGDVQTSVSTSPYAVRYLRANCTVLTGGTTPTVTAWVNGVVN